MSDKDPVEESTINRVVPMPLGMWNEVLELSKSSGIDPRDAMVQLIDIGMQADEKATARSRVITFSLDVWKRISETATRTKVDVNQLLLHLVDLGLQSKGLGPGKVVSEWVETTIAVRVGPDSWKRLRQCSFRGGLPEAGEVIMVNKIPYVVLQRAWNVGAGSPTAVLKVRRYKTRRA